VILEGASGPFVVGQVARVDTDLWGHIIDRSGRILADVAWEACVDLEELQHQREPESGGAALVGDQLALVVLDQRPAGDQVLRLPLPPHAASSAESVCGTLPARSAENYRRRHIRQAIACRLALMGAGSDQQVRSCQLPARSRHFSRYRGGPVSLRRVRGERHERTCCGAGGQVS